jgi:hypothetical protein
MKVLFSGSSFCDEATTKRLFVIADEIAFMDRPSVTFGNWGMIGHATPARRYSSAGSPVQLSTYREKIGEKIGTATIFL